jgi:3-deoxy-manno-octulosonate cytidylyltransferase (CMP-KDO synthetase)
MTRILAVVPARMSSSRFPGKPLETINGIPMIAHCYFRALKAKEVTKVVLATPDAEIMQFGKDFGIETVLTSDKHERATERAEEALQIYKKQGEEYDYVLLLQGDEPQIDPEEIDNLALALKNSSNCVVNIIHPIEGEDMTNSSIVKSILDSHGNILFFSRAHIPNKSNSGYRQLGMIGFTAKILEKYCELEPTTLEITESIDMMRFLENDIEISSLMTHKSIIGVDHPEDIKKVELLMANDLLVEEYSNLFIKK